jgi:hypothetical protein
MFFRELTKTQPGKQPAWLRWILNKIQLWRVDRARARIEGIDGQIKSHKEGTIVPLEREIQAIEEEGTMRAALLGKTPLENYLRELPDSQHEITWFEQIERILNDKLPPSAYENWAWWANEKEGNHVNARAWANAGWKVESVDFNTKRVTLVRIG